MLTSVLITKNNELKVIPINPLKLEETIETKGKDNIRFIHSYFYENIEIIYHGWTNGKENDINKHDLAPPIDKTLFYGDLLVLLKEDGELTNLSVEDYEEFYDYIFAGFDSCEEDENEYVEEDYDYEDGFIVKD